MIIEAPSSFITPPARENKGADAGHRSLGRINVDILDLMQRAFFPILVLAGGMIAIGQNTPSVKQQPPYRIGGDVTAPVVVSKTEPRYTDEARIAKLEGTVGIAMVVNEEGVPMTCASRDRSASAWMNTRSQR